MLSQQQAHQVPRKRLLLSQSLQRRSLALQYRLLSGQFQFREKLSSLPPVTPTAAADIQKLSALQHFKVEEVADVFCTDLFLHVIFHARDFFWSKKREVGQNFKQSGCVVLQGRCTAPMFVCHVSRALS
jgi:hypothetical protein